MTVKRHSRRAVLTIGPQEDNEDLIDSFISKGGKTTEESKPLVTEDEEEKQTRFTLRISEKDVAMIDEKRKKMVGNVSRNNWILQAIADKLKEKG